jgi:hypothetical protein
MRPPSPRLIPVELRPASLQNWIECCAIAWRMLCEGLDDVHVNPNEPWASAISRLAATILADSGYGLARGYDSDRWDDVARAVASRASCAVDGRVQGPSGRVAADSLPVEPPTPDRRALIEAEWEKVPVLE